jgi:hypothetical protein
MFEAEVLFKISRVYYVDIVMMTKKTEIKDATF